MKILVAGGAGYVGSSCTQYLLDHGHEVIVYDSLVKGYRHAVDERASFVHGDLADRDKLNHTFRGQNIDGVIHFAAFIEVGESMRDPGRYFNNNVCAAHNLLATAHEAAVPKFVFSSTAAVYGKPQEVPVSEAAATNPINPYGESKLMFENIMRWYHEIHGMQCVALRYFNAAGATAKFGEAHQPESHLIPLVFDAAVGKRDCISIYGTDYPTPDGTCIRDYVHVTDLAQAHLLALLNDYSGAFNLGSGHGHSVRSIIDTVQQVSGRQVQVRTAPRRPGDPPKLISDSTAARTKLGWQPEHDNIDEIITSVWNWRQQYPNGYAIE